jgi:AsmA protein
MPKGLKIVLIIVLILLSLAGSLFIYVYQNIDQLKTYAIKEVNLMLKAELKAENIDVTVMKTFPMLSLAFNNISIADPMRPNKFVLQAKSLYLGFDIYDVINERYKINLVDLDSGVIYLYTDKKGHNNFDLIKETT